MPYIVPDARPAFDRVIDDLHPVHEGDLNYIVTCLCDKYISRYGKRYATVNAVIGVLECAKQELYRRVIAPYEDEKRDLNGDVYWC